jgi:hypothetical protein
VTDREVAAEVATPAGTGPAVGQRVAVNTRAREASVAADAAPGTQRDGVVVAFPRRPAPVEAPPQPDPAFKVAVEEPPAEAAPAVEERAGRLRDAVQKARADFAASVFVNGRPPSYRELWQQRRPPIERVPSGNKALWRGWVAYNHVRLLAAAPLYAAIYLFGHPARLAATVPFAALIWAIWHYVWVV